VHRLLAGGEEEEEERNQEQNQEQERELGEFQCQHYRRKCKFVTPCCNGLYRCRFCHDEEENHTLRRDDVSMVECSQCEMRQEVRENCSNCGLKFGQYFCFDCKLYDDEDKQQFHCTGCGICRVGGRDNYFHCHRCDMCLPNHLQGAHKCVEKVSRSNCPVCQEDIHTSRIPSQIPPCNHLIHKTCFDEMLTNGHYACPVCGVSMMDMTDVWKIYDREIVETPMPNEYLDMCAAIQCRDCSKPSLSLFHILGMKCGECGSYNTVRARGPLVRRGGEMLPDLPLIETTEEEDEEEPSLLPMEPMEQEDIPLPVVTPDTPPDSPTRDTQIHTTSTRPGVTTNRLPPLPSASRYRGRRFRVTLQVLQQIRRSAQLNASPSS